MSVPAVLNGYTTLSSPQTGTNAKKLMEKWGSNNLVGVTSQGTSFSTAEDQNVTLEMYSFALDINPAYKDYYPENFEPLNNHKNFVTALISVAEPTLTLQVKGKSGVVGDYKLNSSYTKPQLFASKGECATVKISFANGSITNGAEVKSAIASCMNDAYAEDFYNKLNSTLQQMFLSNTDSENKSKTASTFSGNKWYDENCNVFCLKIYKSTCVYKSVTAQDKIDYNLLSNNGKNVNVNGTEALQGDILWNFEFTQPQIIVDSMTIELPEYVIKGAATKVTSFLISNSTTSNMNK